MLSINEQWSIFQGDCIPHMLEDMEPASMDMAVFSPPFPALYSYTSKEEDIGNSEERGESKIHLAYFYRGLARVLKPGRVACVHVMQIPKKKRNNEYGTFDFRGFNIRLAERSGLVFEYDWCVTKDPQSQAIRTKSHTLQFASLRRDRAVMGGAYPDYILKFRAPGDNAVPVISDGDVSNNDWIQWAEAAWTDIRQTDTLNVREARSEEDTRHICPLQLGVINRLVRLYSNAGETVFSPFTGIGSEGYEAIKLGRRFYGCELKPEYYQQACVNLKRAELIQADAGAGLFDVLECAA